jgi:hypothetical protein
MSDLPARLEALLRIYVADCRGQLDDAKSAEQFRKGSRITAMRPSMRRWTSCRTRHCYQPPYIDP